MAKKNKNPQKRSLFNRLFWWIAEPMVRHRLEEIYGNHSTSSGFEPEEPEAGYTLGELVIFKRADETPEQFRGRVYRMMDRTAPAASLASIDDELQQAEAEIERSEDMVNFYEREIEILEEHLDWLTAQAAKLKAERLRLEKEGQEAVGEIEEMLGL